MHIKKNKIFTFFTDVHQQEEKLFSLFFRTWGLLIFFLIWFVFNFFFYSSSNFIFAHQDFLSLVLIPPILTWKAWSRIDLKNNFSGQMAILFFTIKIWFVFLVINRFCLPLFLAPYNYIEYQFWLRILALGVQILIFGLMSKCSYFHKNPYIFLLIFYFPIGLTFNLIEIADNLTLAIVAIGILFMAYLFVRLIYKNFEVKKDD